MAVDPYVETALRVVAKLNNELDVGYGFVVMVLPPEGSGKNRFFVSRGDNTIDRAAKAIERAKSPESPEGL